MRTKTADSIKIVLTGPESTGKTTLAHQLANIFQCPIVREYARTYLTLLPRPYVELDLMDIARGQMAWQQSLLKDQPPLLIADTDLLTILIWQEQKYGRVDPNLFNQWQQNFGTLYFLCSPDIPWESDPLRESETDRLRLFTVYQKWLQRYNLPFVTLSGNKNIRLLTAQKKIAQLLDSQTNNP